MRFFKTVKKREESGNKVQIANTWYVQDKLKLYWRKL